MMLGLYSFLIGGWLFLVFSFFQLHFLYLIVAMFFVSLANGSTLSLAIAEISVSCPSHTASCIIGFFQIGSAGLVAYMVNYLFGNTYLVLAISIFILAHFSFFVKKAT